MPIAFAASTTTSASWTCSCPSRVTYSTPVASPSRPTSTRLTRAPVISSAPSAIACFQWVWSVLAFAPSGQPHRQLPHCAHARRPWAGTDSTEFVPGHQCQPSRVCARATFSAPAPIGSGG